MPPDIDEDQREIWQSKPATVSQKAFVILCVLGGAALGSLIVMLLTSGRH